MSDRPGVIYIAGYSRSGSTVLDVALGQTAPIASGGELTFFFDELSNPDRTCSCGRPYLNCDRWGKAAHVLSSDADLASAAALTRTIDGGRIRSGTHRGGVRIDAGRRYRQLQRALFLAASSGGDYRWVVDSSKSARDARDRPVALRDFAGLDVRIVHLVRSPWATANSYHSSGSNWVAEGRRRASTLAVERAVLGWSMANKLASSLESEFGSRYVQVRYEDLLGDPSSTLASIGGLIGEDLSQLAGAIEKSQPMTPDHLVGGNRVRRNETIVIAEKRVGEEPISLPLSSRIAVKLVAGHTARALGYLENGATVGLRRRRTP